MATPLSVAKLPAEIEIPRGAGLRTAIEQLDKGGVAVRPLQFELLARALGREREIKAGNYQLLQPLTPLELLRKLTRGDVTQAEARLIEGWTFAQLRAALDASPDLRHDTAGLDETQVLGRVGAAELHPEGLFFPDTYLFARGTSDVAVLRRAYGAMQRHLAEEWSKRDPTNCAASAGRSSPTTFTRRARVRGLKASNAASSLSLLRSSKLTRGSSI